MPHINSGKFRPPEIIGLLVLIAAAAWAFSAGLGGELIFDDIPNFLPWSNLQDITSRDPLLSFVFSGTGVPGRPLSLLSFLIDDQSWPPDIFALKRTNLAIHLLNLCLILWLCLKVFRRLLPGADERRVTWLALLASAIWALHPMQVSNVSYVIQRMNLLSTLIELAGLLLFMYGRERLAESPRRALILCSVGIGFCVPFAITAKENGLLLCAFALLVEAFCYGPAPTRWWRIWKAIFLWLPLLAFVAYCLREYRGFTVGYANRDFTAWERLLTQGPVLVDYLDKLVMPRLRGSGLYFDNFPVSRSLLQPVTTLFAWLLLLASLAGAFLLRRRMPVVSFGVFFYFTGHLMESTVLPLELYFEHRNYLPQAGLWIAAAGALHYAPTRVARIALPATAVVLVLLVALTRQNAALWSQPELQVAIWYHDNPGSLRATSSYANVLLKKGDFTRVNEVLEAGQRANPNDLSALLSQRYINCYWQDLPTAFDDLVSFARHADYETASVTTLEKMRELGNSSAYLRHLEHCKPASTAQIAAVYRAMLENRRYISPRTRARLNEYLAEIAASNLDLNAAMHYYDEAFRHEANPIYPYRQARLLLSAGLTDDAERFAALAEQSNTGRRRLLYPELKDRIPDLKKDIKAARGHSR